MWKMRKHQRKSSRPTDRLLYRHRRGANSGRKALSFRRHRSHVEVCLRTARRKGPPRHRFGLRRAFTDNGIQFRLPPRYTDGPTARYLTHIFGLRCKEHGIEHRFTKINHPWTNGQVERSNRTIKEATVNRYYYDDTNCAIIFLVSSTPTTSADGSRPSKASHPTSSSANARLQSPNDS